jgi:hypothetical protein
MHGTEDEQRDETPGEEIKRAATARESLELHC